MTLTKKLKNSLPNFINSFYASRISSALINNDLDGLKSLLTKYALDNSPEHRKDIISQALQKENYSAIKIMFDCGFDPNQINEKNQSLLYVASQSGNYSFSKILIDAGANVNNLNGRENKTPLMIASEVGNPQIVKLLMDNQADPDLFYTSAINDYDSIEREMINIEEYTNRKPFHYTVHEVLHSQSTLMNALMCALDGTKELRLIEGNFENRLGCIRILIEHGANVDAENDYGVNFKQFAVHRNKGDLVDLVESLQEHHFLSDSISYQNDERNNSLHF